MDIILKMGDLESGRLVDGLSRYADKSKNFHVRLAMAKLTRKIKKETAEPFEEYQDFLRVYGQKVAGGGMAIVPSSLTKEKAEELSAKLKEWREKEIKLDLDPVLGKEGLEIHLPQPELEQFPISELEMLAEFNIIPIAAPRGESEVQTLTKKVETLESAIKEMKPQ